MKESRYTFAMMQGEKLRVTITGLNNEGEGVVRAGDERFVLFVPDALPGEEATVRLVQLKKNYGLAKVLARHCSSADRREPLCPDFSRCGGCQLQHMNYASQLRLKTQTVCDALKRIAGLDEPPVSDCLSSPQQWGCRNKASLPTQNDRLSKIKAGFYKKRSHDIVPFTQCPVLIPALERQILSLLAQIRQEGLCGYDESKPDSNTNLLRHIISRKAFFTSESLSGIVLKRPPSGYEKKALQRIAVKISESSNGFIENINDKNGNFIWGDSTTCLSGRPVMEEQLGRFRFKMEISSFFQVNSAQALNLYNYAAGEALKDSPENILELYAGVGSLTAFLAAGCKKLTAVESWLPAAEYIAVNAELNGLGNITSSTGLAEEVTAGLTDQKYETVVLDPPRTGCAPAVISALLKIAPATIVYVSCNPATLSRDAKALISGGYKLLTAQPFDMFPQTGHVETVATFVRL